MSRPRSEIFAPEILSHIFSFFPFDKRPRNLGSFGPRHRFQTLLSCALVCKPWRRPAQRELWSQLDFSGDKRRWERFVNAGRIQSCVLITRELYLVSFWRERDVAVIVSQCRGLSKLQLGEMWMHLSMRVFRNEALVGLSHLNLCGVHFDRLVDTSIVKVSFNHLTTLNISIDTNDETGSLGTPLPLLASLLQPSLTSFSLWPENPNNEDVESTLTLIESHANTITRLAFAPLEERFISLERLGTFLSHFTNLREVVLPFDSISVLAHCGPQLEILRLVETFFPSQGLPRRSEENENFWEELPIDLVKVLPPSFAKLRVLDLQVEYDRLSRAGKDELEKLEKRTPVPAQIVKLAEMPGFVDWEI